MGGRHEPRMQFGVAVNSRSSVTHIHKMPKRPRQPAMAAAAVLAAAAAERLELVTAANTSGYKCVTWNQSSSKYVAQVKDGGNNVHLGYFITVEEAAGRPWPRSP